jgi:gamma-glutamylcyclotransferase
MNEIERRWYFAYGSNMLPDQMAKRTGETAPAMVCRLLDYRLAFNKRYFLDPVHVHANIVHSVGDQVWGVAYHCTLQAIQKIDLWENVLEDSYRHHDVEVLLTNGDSLSAFAYISGPGALCDDGAPPAEYLNRIVSGALHNGLPAAYIESIHRFARPEHVAKS